MSMEQKVIVSKFIRLTIDYLFFRKLLSFNKSLENYKRFIITKQLFEEIILVLSHKLLFYKIQHII